MTDIPRQWNPYPESVPPKSDRYMATVRLDDGSIDVIELWYFEASQSWRETDGSNVEGLVVLQWALWPAVL